MKRIAILSLFFLSTLSETHTRVNLARTAKQVAAVSTIGGLGIMSFLNSRHIQKGNSSITSLSDFVAEAQDVLNSIPGNVDQFQKSTIKRVSTFPTQIVEKVEASTQSAKEQWNALFESTDSKDDKKPNK
jgi:hypothetical protein